MAEFWPFYLGEHRSPRTRAWHLAGTLGYLLLGITCLVTGHPRWLWAAPVVAYGCAWYSHFAIERNRPATFRHPLKSLLCDHRLAWCMVTGRMEAELERYGIRSTGP
jgi:hypothetical protein